MTATISSLVFGILAGTIMTNLYNARRIITMKRDWLAALMNQAQDSYRTGYMHGYAGKNEKDLDKIHARSVYQSANV
jgi:hypothetical protein